MILVIILFGVIAFLEVPQLVKQKHIYELKVFGAIFLFAFLMALLLSCNVRIPSPLRGIGRLIEAVMQALGK